MPRKRPPIGVSGPPRPLDVRLAEARRKVEKLELITERKEISRKLRGFRIVDPRTVARRKE